MVKEMKRAWIIVLLAAGLLAGCGQAEPPGFTEHADLRAARAALLDAMRADGDPALPDDAGWRPLEVQTIAGATTYVYENGRWRMELALPPQSPAAYLYRARVTGPGDFVYAAEVRANYQIIPAQ
jgi:hypothetical protein